MTDEKLTQLVKEFLSENSIDDGLKDYLAKNGYVFANEEEWKSMLRPVVGEMGVPEDLIEETIRDTFED
jgi:hypothetical protein